jgi:hypothetical protein
VAADEIIDFRGERSRHRYFVGREDVLAEIDRALFDGSLDGRWVLVTGNPGMGKSALLSACVERVKARLGSEPPHHFLRRGQHDWDRPDAVVRSLVTVTPDLLCAGNDIGDLWVLETTSRPERLETTSTTRPLRLFYSYSHKDEALRDELETHLAILERQGLIAPWHDRRIEPGTSLTGAIDSNLEEADIILLLVSADFIASPYCYEKEMLRALERHHAHQARVIPIILRATHFEGAPFEKLQALPKDAKPVTGWKDRDEAWTDVARGLRLVVESLRAPNR